MSFDFVLTERFVWSYCGVVVAFALGVAAKLVLGARVLRVELRGLTDELAATDGKEAFARVFEQYNSRVKVAFGLPWTEFVETLVLPAPGASDPIRNTGEVSRHLNDSTIIFPRISFGFYQSVPNLLTGLGILGTFIGLAVGVGEASAGLSSSNSDEITFSLQQLLDGASLAFLTSIAGIACSILFVPVDRVVSRRLHLAVDAWVAVLESRLERVTPEGVALQQLDEARRAVTQLEHFNTELIFSLEKALDEKIAGRLSPQLERLVDAVEGLRTDRSTDAGQMIEQALDRFTDAMQQQTGSQFKEMASIVDDLNRTLKESAAGLAQSQQDVRTALESVLTSVRTSMDSGANAMTETLQKALESVTREMEKALENVTRKMEDASRQMADRMTDSSADASAELRGSVGSATRGLVEAATRIAEQQRDVRTALESVLTTVRTSMDSGANAMTEALQKSLGDVTDVIADASRRMADQMTASSADASAELSGSVGSATQGLVEAATRMAEQQRDVRAALESVLTTVRTSMDSGANAMTEALQKSLGDVTDVIADASRRMADQMTASSADASAELSERVGSATQALANTGVEAAARVSESLDGLHASAKSLDRSTHQSERILAGMTTFVDRLDQLRDSVESAHRQIAAVAEPLGLAAGEIRASSDRSADTLARTSDLVGRVEGLVNTLEQHQRSVAATWIGYQERFENIDDSLAKVFREIDEGLERYCEQVKQFANELDADTSKVVQHLAGATAELGQSIEDLTDHLGRAR